MTRTRAALALLSLLLGCSGKDLAPLDSAPTDIRVLDTLGAKNLLLIHVDTLRGDHMPWYGGVRTTFPSLIQRNWTVVDGYTATTSWTGTATASVLAGATSAQHGVLYPLVEGASGSTNAVLELGTLAEHLALQGYATALFAGNDYVGETSGISKGFEHQVQAPELLMHSNAGDLLNAMLDWMGAQPPGQPLFVMMQPIDPHMPYSPMEQDYGAWSDTTDPLFDRSQAPAEMEATYRAMLGDPATQEQARTELTDLYDEQLLGLDRSIEELLFALEKLGMLDDTLVVLAADHGESLGELDYTQFGHGMSFRPEVLRVPLLFLTPAGSPARVSCLSSGTDLAPTLVQALGLPPMAVPDGVAMQESCREVTFSSFATVGGLVFASAQDEDRMLIASCGAGELEGLDLLADPYGRVTVDLSAEALLTDALAEGLDASTAVTPIGACDALR